MTGSQEEYLPPKIINSHNLKKITSQQFPVFIASGLCSMQALEHF